MTDPKVIHLSQSEIDSQFDRQRNAELVILQLPEHHDGRNTWLMNYGFGEEAINLRKKNKLIFDTRTRSAAKAPAPTLKFSASVTAQVSRIAVPCAHCDFQNVFFNQDPRGTVHTCTACSKDYEIPATADIKFT